MIGGSIAVAILLLIILIVIIRKKTIHVDAKTIARIDDEQFKELKGNITDINKNTIPFISLKTHFLL